MSMYKVMEYTKKRLNIKYHQLIFNDISCNHFKCFHQEWQVSCSHNAFINMNSTVKMCPIDVYEEKKDWIPIFSSISYGIGAIVCGSWMYSLWKDARNQQKVWTIFGIFKAWIKILVIL